MDENQKILLVDDEQNILFAIKRELHTWATERNIELVTALSAKEGLRFLEDEAKNVVLIVSDLRMPEMKGSDFLLAVKDQYPWIVTILLTGFSETEEIIKAVSAGIFSYMLKPWDAFHLLSEIQKAYDYGESKRQNALYHKRLEDELKWAGEMQKNLLRPNIPFSEGIEFRVSYRPVTGLYCSGDYYDVIQIGTDRYMVLVGDVSGHGIKAAIVTGILKAVIYPEYIRGKTGKQISLSDFLGWLNSRIQFEFRSNSDLFLTFFSGIIDLKDNSFTYANAGQNHPFLLSKERIIELPASGTALGFSRSPLYPENKVSFLPGDLLVFYTDGLTEAAPGVNLAEVLKSVPYGADYHQRIIKATLKQKEMSDMSDDITILTARRTQ